MTSVRTTCPYCGVGCGVLASPDAQGGARIAGDPAHPANFGRLCSKGTALGETLMNEGRLLAPQVAGCPASWDNALDLVAQRFRRIIDEHGPDSVAFYVSGQLLTEDYYAANKLMKGYIGSANIDTNSRLCMASTVAGHKRAFGTDMVPGTYEDLETADMVVLVGSNLAWCHPVLHQRLLAARAERGTRVVTIDPRRTATSDTGDQHLGLLPGSDVALFSGLLGQIASRGAQDAAWLEAHVDGAEAAFGATLSVAQAARQTGLDPQVLGAFYDTWIDTPRVVTVFSQGVNQASDGSDKVNAIINCHLATGRIGRPGMGPFSVTGQPNAMGGREVGGLANMLANHLNLEVPEHRDLVQDFWKSPRIARAPGLKAVDLFEACASGQIKALWVMCTNPAISMPQGNRVAEALRACPFVVVSDIIAETDTTALADVLLPATGWGEKDGTVTNSERRISRQRRFRAAPGAARDDWRIIADVAQRMGYAGFDWQTPGAVFDEYAELSVRAADAGADLDLSGLTGLSEQAYDALEPVQWPVTRDRAGGRFFGQGGFFTDTGRAKMLALTPRASLTQTDAEHPFLLNTGRVRDHWHTMTRTGLAPTLNRHMAEPFVELHPDDATALGVSDAELLQVTSDAGEIIARARLTDRMPHGQVFAPMHWTAQTSEAARVNRTMPPVTDPVSGQPELKRAAVTLQPLAPAWYGFAISRAEPTPTTTYWAKARAPGGWRVELAGAALPRCWEAFAREFLQADGEDMVSAIDTTAGRTRLIFATEGEVTAALYVAPGPVEVARDFVTEALQNPAITAEQIVTGLPPRDRPDAGATVCACFGVGANTIRQAVIDGRAATLDQIGTLLQAGTNCGSCRPEVQAILNAAALPLAAE